MASLPISNSCGNFFVTGTGSASASMSLTSVSPITGRGVPPSLHTRSDGQTKDTHRTLRHIRLYIYLLAMSDLAAPVSSRAWTCSPEISSYIQNGDSTAISGPLKPYVVWLDTEKHLRNGPHCSMRRLAVGCSRHPVRSLLAQWLGFRFTKCTALLSWLTGYSHQSCCRPTSFSSILLTMTGEQCQH